MHWNDSYFYREDGSRYFPMGLFGCYFNLSYVGEEMVANSQHGNALIEFQHCTVSVWRKFFQFLADEGCTAIRMFPRGDCGGSAWEGLDIGGRVHRALFEKMKAYLRCAREYGIRLQLCLFTEPECSFYCQRDTRTYWGRRLWKDEELRCAAPSQKRFLDNPDDIVSYDDFFTDPDVRDCCHRFLDEILPRLSEFGDDLFAIELFNESGWASPHARPMNTFRWEDTPGYLDWHRDMAEHVRRVVPHIPLCISNPGVSILGHDTIHWSREIGPDFFSVHNYPDICGSRPGIDYAAINDMLVQYTSACVPTMMGEWRAYRVTFAEEQNEDRVQALLSRDTAWMTMLSGAPGCISWLARGYGEYHAVTELFSQLDAYALVPSAPLVIDIAAAQAWFEVLWKQGAAECVYPDWKWCPDRDATDGGHRFCIKSESQQYAALLNVERWSLESGIPVRFALGEGIPLESVTHETFAAYQPYLAPIAGYQQKAFSADDDRLRVVYLRNIESVVCVTKDNDGQPVECYTMRRQKAAPVTLCGMDSAYRVRLLDLETRCMSEIDPTVPLGLGVTDHDFVVLMEQK
ncbi:MAG: hypothetical protein E7604_02635 [Ruminococcaceae bacterium]|nr:hypothetical protein [Oscillospiraceae bacterium]